MFGLFTEEDKPQVGQDETTPVANQEPLSQERPTPGSDAPKFRPEDEKTTPARRVVEGAMLTALATVLGILAFYMPVLGIIAVFLWPIPIAFLIKRHGIVTGLLALAAVGLLLGMITGPLNAVAILLNIGFVGIWYGYAFRKNLSGAKTLFVGVVVAAVSVICMLLLSAWTMGLAFASIATQINEMVKAAVDMYQQAGVLEAMLGGMTVDEFTLKMQEMVKTLLPASMIIVAMAEAFISYLATGAVFRRFGYQVTKLPPFKEWHLPWVSLWGLIIALLAQLGAWQFEIEHLQALAVNVLYLYMPILIVAGISLVMWLGRKNQSPLLKVFLVVAIVFFTQYALYLLLMLGLLDSIVDVRKFFRSLEEQAKKMGK